MFEKTGLQPAVPAGGRGQVPMVRAGVDLCQISRIDRALKRRGEIFLNRLFTAGELRYCSRYKGRRYAAALAARFAAKEALAKALGYGLWGPGGLAFKDIEVVNGELGAPSYDLHGGAELAFKKAGGLSLALSLAHEKDLALATCQMLCLAEPESESESESESEPELDRLEQL